MTDTLRWWHQESPYFLNETLAFINSSRSRDEAIGRCEELCKALNKTWNAFFQYRRRNGELNETERQNDAEGERSDTQSLRELILHGIDGEHSSELCGSESLRRFAELTPHIMNHNILLTEAYDPLNITEDVRKKASVEHRQLFRAFQRFTATPIDPSLRAALLKKTATMLYVVRSNIAHSEKTPQGADRSKSERDEVVSDAAASVIEDLFDILFDRPSQRLAVYGTLAPDGPNASELAGIKGQWQEGTVQGAVEQRDGFLEFTWSLTPDVVSVKVLSAFGLRERFDRLDRFEGRRYRRILVPILIDGKMLVSNIYEGRRRTLKSRTVAR